ncbi:hypothetical protein LQ51_26065, partial [Micromonospora sp. HK10]
MSESGQPGAPTPGEHGDGTGRQDDLARTGSGWAPPATGWARGADAPGGSPRSEPATGWAASSPRFGDLPAPLPALPVEEPSARVNGRHVNGVPHAGEESPVTRQAPVSAPPADPPHRETDRPVVPAQRPAPGVEQPAADADSGPARHASDESPAGRWAEGGVPSSAPPALQVPPVGAAASGFEVPPGFHAPAVDRSAEQPPSLSRGWADRPPTEPPSLSAGWAARPSSAPPAEPDRSGRPSSAPPADPEHPGPVSPAAQGWGDRPLPAQPGWADRAAPAGHDPSPVGPPRGTADEQRTGPAAEQPAHPAGAPDWAAPSWNQPSRSGAWAPPWGRPDPASGHRAGDEPGRAALRAAGEEQQPGGQEADAATGREDSPAARRARDEWAPGPTQPSEPTRAEQPPGYAPPGAERPGGYQPPGAERSAGYPAAGAERSGGYDLPAAERSAGYPPAGAERPGGYELPGAEQPGGYEPRRAERPGGYEPWGAGQPGGYEPR